MYFGNLTNLLEKTSQARVGLAILKVPYKYAKKMVAHHQTYDRNSISFADRQTSFQNRDDDIITKREENKFKNKYGIIHK